MCGACACACGCNSEDTTAMVESINRRKRIQILVEVNTDPVPGWGYNPGDFVRLIERDLNRQIPHYNPTVDLIDDNWARNRIKNFSLNSDLDHPDFVNGEYQP